MACIDLRRISLTLGGNRLFEDINLSIESGEKVALVGRNGSGKSTLLKVMAGVICLDAGVISVRKGIRTAYLDQLVPRDILGTIFDIVKSGIFPSPDRESEADRKQLQQIEKTISQLGLDGGLIFNDLSAGLKRQVLLAKAIVGEPEILLLDEPTNHMDIDAITRLEETLLRFRGAVVFVTHDRMFLQKLASSP